jgi:GH43 family beta-xylosidase
MMPAGLERAFWWTSFGMGKDRMFMAQIAKGVVLLCATVALGAERPGGPAAVPGGPSAAFANPLYAGADPWVVRHGGQYYLCQAGPGRAISVWKSPTLADRGMRSIVWRAPGSGWNRAEVWAPELHFLRGRWYIYYAACTGDNADHRMGVLESAGDDPLGPYADRGMLYTGDDISTKRNNRWAIDGTVLEQQQKLYFIWSGWPDDRDQQYLYIARMENPWTIASNRVRICNNCDYVWERVGEDRRQRGLNEGPAVLQRNGRVFLIYSCSGSWEPSYKLGMLYADESADPMDAKSWTKLNRPVFQSDGEVFGVGHCSFTRSLDDREDWIVFHSKVSRTDGWARVVRAQRFGWTKDGFPDFGRPGVVEAPR